MSGDIFDFWAECPDDAKVHPADADAFARPFIGNLDTFDRKCLPACFAGPLRTAPVVLLYLSPGWGQSDVDEASTKEAQARYGERRKGYQPLDGADEHAGHYRWWTQRTAVYGDPKMVRDKIAFLNLCAYHSRSFAAHVAPAILPSSRTAINWAYDVLFPQARDGERVVVCMRAAAQWGLEPGKTYGKSLYAPKVVRSGHMRKTEEHAVIRQEIVNAVTAAIG